MRELYRRIADYNSCFYVRFIYTFLYTVKDLFLELQHRTDGKWSTCLVNVSFVISDLLFFFFFLD